MGWAASALIGQIPSRDDDRAAWSLVAPALLTVGGFTAMGLRFGPRPVLPAYCYLTAVSVGGFPQAGTACHHE